MPHRPHEVEGRAHVFHGADEPGDVSHIARASVTWREVQRTSSQGQEAERENGFTGETEPGSKKIWATKNCGLNVTR